ncbi:MAG: class I SAM-dependent methyltransferase [Treponema sp.]|jgi:SAM-dependent methyltransferase|nr:class I SAM-dependent methyltransferase [Treponema sp.]
MTGQNKSPHQERPQEWFNDESFWNYYAPIMFDDAHWAEVPAVADGLTRLARLKLYGASPARPREGAQASDCVQAPGPRILDLCCGMGRISLELARRGFAVTGVDITRSFLEAARDDSGYEKLNTEFILEDARSFKRPLYFDTAVNLYISFGYFENPDDDFLVLRNVCESLKPGGAFIIETLGKEIAVRDFTQGEWFERSGYTVLTEYHAVDSWAGLHNRWILIKGGERIERTFTQRLYAASELRALLLKAGFASVELYGGWDESPYDQNAAQLIAVGRKGV